VQSLQVQRLHREVAKEGGRTMRNPMCQGELLEEERVSALKVGVWEPASSGGKPFLWRAIKLLLSLLRHT